MDNILNLVTTRRYLALVNTFFWKLEAACGWFVNTEVYLALILIKVLERNKDLPTWVNVKQLTQRGIG